MPRKYKPDTKIEYGCGMYDGDVYHEPIMKEDPDGQWVKLKTFEDETARLRAENARLKKQVAALQLKLNPPVD